MNENYLIELGCKAHRYQSTCLDCRNEHDSPSDLDWEKVEKLVEIVEGSKGKYVLAKYSWRNDPTITFATANSNYDVALKNSMREHKAIVKKYPNGKELLARSMEKNLKTGAYKILNEQEAAQILKGPHHFLKNFLVHNHNSKSSPIREVLNGSAFSTSAV